MNCCSPRTDHGTRHGTRSNGGCCCCGQQGGFPHHYLSKDERRKLLEGYRNNLKAELAEVEKRLQSPESED